MMARKIVHCNKVEPTLTGSALHMITQVARWVKNVAFAYVSFFRIAADGYKG